MSTPSDRENGVFARVMRDERLWIAAIAVIVSLVLLQAYSLYRLPQVSGKQEPIDIVAFFTAGHLVWDGLAAEAYHHPLFERHQLAIGRIEHFMPWAYPPQTFFLVAPLGLAPIWLTYAIYMFASFALFCFAVKRLAGPWAPGALAVALPAAIINTRAGQIGFVVAALTGLFLAGLRAGRSRAGLPLGLMIVKPHLAAGIGLLALAGRRWGIVAVAAATVIATSLLATLAFGPEIWPAFRTALSRSGDLLADGRFPLSRMTSVYAFGYRSGFGAGPSLAAHVAVALAALAAMLWLVWRRVKLEWQMAAAVAAGLLVSPYCYDYDWPMLALAAALLLPDLARRMRGWELAAIFALVWLATANAQMILFQVYMASLIAPAGNKVMIIPWTAPVLAVAAGWIVLGLRRDASDRQAAA